ncbi:hypothetical protein FJU11_14940 [Pararhizobium mangrovi]|uniref:Uncharacterized protein n=1 Tax=Pararhizobium mangrovi TaxID=2590452 RepID=A0A506U180_9HYPH|nr:hypothetical protein FJU11_14940 [Pararhizobium mangrovi]
MERKIISRFDAGNLTRALSASKAAASHWRAAHPCKHDEVKLPLRGRAICSKNMLAEVEMDS